LKNEVGHSEPQKRAVHVNHYYLNYDQPEMPPSWSVLEATSFGSLAYLIRQLTAANAKSVAWLINIPEPALKSWTLSLSYLRNLCAHHNRIWNRTHTIKPYIIKQYASDLTPNDKTYAQAVTTWVLQKKFPVHRTGMLDWVIYLISIQTYNSTRLDFPLIGDPGLSGSDVSKHRLMPYLAPLRRRSPACSARRPAPRGQGGR
jgi:abortive infection bacteriophage resistance protein